MGPKESQSDWFLPAIFSNGDVKECLAAVIRSQQFKTAFIAQLQIHLISYRGKSSDSLTELSQRVRRFESTLNFRMGMLAPERKGAWFRESLKQKTGPFPESILSEPVFAPYQAEDVDKLQQSIQRSWHERKVLPLPFTLQQPCLWLSLLELNQAYEQICVLDRPFQDCRLDKLPESLPPELATPSLDAFLKRVAQLASTVRGELDRCYESLWNACNRFWDEQRRETRRKNQRPHNYQRTAEDIRFRFKERRSQVRRAHTTADLQALRYFGFETFPEKAELRRKYHELARKYHPDSPTGNENEFKTLTRYYNHLVNRIGSALFSSTEKESPVPKT